MEPTDPLERARAERRAVLGRMEEFKVHAAAHENAGVTNDELDELLFQIAAYCGAPAAVSARRALQEVRPAGPGPG